MKRQLEALLDGIPSLQAIEVGLNVAEGDAAFDVVLTTIGEDEVLSGVCHGSVAFGSS